MFILIVLVCVFVYLVYDTMCRRCMPPANSLVPVYPGRLPLFGHVLKFLNVRELKNQMESIGTFSYTNGGISTFYFGPLPLYFVTHPDDVSTVLNKCMVKLPLIYKLIEPLLGKTLISADVPTWKRTRRITDMGFKQNILEDYLKLFNSEADRLVQVFAEDVGKGVVDITDKIAKSRLEFTCRTTMGLQVDGKDLVNDKYIIAIDTIFELLVLRVSKFWNLWDPIFKFNYGKQMAEAEEIFFSLSREMIKLRKEEHLQRLKNKDLNCQGHRFRSFLDVLIENCVTETGSTLTDNEMRNIVNNVLVAGFDTTISELILLLVCIGSKTHVQDKIYQEIMDVLGEDGKVTRDNMSKLVYIEAVIKEAIRLYPIAMVVGRLASTDVQLRNNITLPAGSFIIAHIWGTNRYPEFWGNDAEEFKPERWLSDTLPEHPAAFATFSPGKRGCPGKVYTLMSFKAIIVALIRRFKLTSDLSKLKVEFKIMLKPVSGHHIKIENR